MSKTGSAMIDKMNEGFNAAFNDDTFVSLSIVLKTIHDKMSMLSDRRIKALEVNNQIATTYDDKEVKAMHAVALCTLIMDGMIDKQSFDNTCTIMESNTLVLPYVNGSKYRVRLTAYLCMCSEPADFITQSRALLVVHAMQQDNKYPYTYIKALKECYIKEATQG